ncbi:MAG TPA: hypothetical protein VK204_01220 [Nocardioidaceae bacterium]|nr:hypothetical protein [Nocardioidaceae bacterium]
MNLDELIDLLNTAQNQNCGYLVAKSPHGTYTFDVVDVEVGLNTGNVVLRLQPVTE